MAGQRGGGRQRYFMPFRARSRAMMRAVRVTRGSPIRASRPKHRATYPWEFRRKAVKLYLEEGLPPKLICRELGIHESVLYALTM